MISRNSASRSRKRASSAAPTASCFRRDRPADRPRLVLVDLGARAGVDGQRRPATSSTACATGTSRPSNSWSWCSSQQEEIARLKEAWAHSEQVRGWPSLEGNKKLHRLAPLWVAIYDAMRGIKTPRLHFRLAVSAVRRKHTDRQPIDGRSAPGRSGDSYGARRTLIGRVAVPEPCLHFE